MTQEKEDRRRRIPPPEGHVRVSRSRPVLHAVGARPNFVKMNPVIQALAERGAPQVVVHTGQHYDHKLSDSILTDLDFPEPDEWLGVGSMSHGRQTGLTLIEFEDVLLKHKPAVVVLAGDVNATLGCALAASKLHIPVAHVESGLRSGDWSMPEEVNRVLTDRLSEVLFTHSPEAGVHLGLEGHDADRIRYIGNTMIDSLLKVVGRARELQLWSNLGLSAHEYVLVTLHRPTNVDDADRLTSIVDALSELARKTAVVFPIHPRTRRMLDAQRRGRVLSRAGVICLPALGYAEFISLELAAGAVITDSGGVQEETTALGVDCYTFRPNTERPITLTAGTNTLIGEDPAAILNVLPSRSPPVTTEVPLWDGRAGERAAGVLESLYFPAADRSLATSTRL